MTFPGPAERPVPSLSGVVRYLVGVAGLAFSLTILWLSMRLVMEIGGFCASGGPFVPAVECPEAVIALTPLSVFGLFLFGGLALWGAASLGGGWAGVLSLAWPALFLSLGWNFLEFGFNPPGAGQDELAWGWIICGVVFAVMGGGPLLGAIWAIREARRGEAPGSWPSPHGSHPIATSPRGGYQLRLVDRRPARPGGRGPADGTLADRLERLARLRFSGDLTDAEFEAAKRATLEEAGA